MSATVPFPPEELMQRVGRLETDDLESAYVSLGATWRERIDAALPDDWSWDGRRVLDFGCGAGRTLRHFLDRAEIAELYGCDLDQPSIAWLRENMPQVRAFVSGEAPGLPQEDDFFDLIWALSVFTHLTDHWAGWLAELHRVLKPGGYLVATVLGEASTRDFNVGPWNEDEIGMNVLLKWNTWDDGGPIVVHSEWWVREHWGRAFDVLDYRARPNEQTTVVLRARDPAITPAELERPSDDPRELAALRRNVEQLQAESAELRRQNMWLREAYEGRLEEIEWLKKTAESSGELERTRAELARIADSRSWRLTTPLRTAAGWTRRVRG